MKNIAIIISCLYGGGAERIAGLLSKELVKKYKVYLFLLDTKNKVYEYDGEIIDIGKSYPFFEYSILYNKRKYNIDIAISFLELFNFANIRTRKNEKVIISERCVQSLINPPSVAERYKIKKYYNYSDAVIACSEGVKFDLIHNYDIKEGLINVVYNFIDKNYIEEKAKECVSDEVLDFLEGEEYFVNIGRLDHQKNQKRLIKQFGIFRSRYKINIKLLIIGNGILKNELEEDIRNLGLLRNIKIIPYTKNPFRYLKNARAMILSSHYEGLPNVILESMALGCPIIATDCLAGPRELLSGELNYKKSFKKIEIVNRGILVCDDATEDNGDTQYMAMAMNMLNDDVLISQLKENGKRYMSYYVNENIIKQWLKVIENTTKLECNLDILENEYKILDNAKHIIIYGAGYVAKSYYLRLRNRYKIDYFAVTHDPSIDSWMGIPICRINELESMAADAVVIVGVRDDLQNEVVATLDAVGFKNIAFPYIDPISREFYDDNPDMATKKELADFFILNGDSY